MLKFGIRFRLKSGLVVMQHLRKHYSIFMKKYKHNLIMVLFCIQRNYFCVHLARVGRRCRAGSVGVPKACGLTGYSNLRLATGFRSARGFRFDVLCRAKCTTDFEKYLYIDIIIITSISFFFTVCIKALCSILHSN